MAVVRIHPAGVDLVRLRRCNSTVRFSSSKNLDVHLHRSTAV